MAAIPQPPLPGRAHRNHGLFSDHYLDDTLPGRDGWRRLQGRMSRETGLSYNTVKKYLGRLDADQGVATAKDGDETSRDGFTGGGERD